MGKMVLTSITAAAMFLATFGVDAEAQSCTHGTATVGGQQVTTNTYDDGANTVTNYVNTASQVVRTDMSDFWGNFTALNYSTVVGQRFGSNALHHYLCADQCDTTSHSPEYGDPHTHENNTRQSGVAADASCS